MQTVTIFTCGPRDSESVASVIERLKQQGVTAVADCRSQTENRRTPGFSQYTFRQTLKVNGIAYAYLGNTIGDRPEDKNLYDAEGTLKRTSLVRTRTYREGINRLVDGTQKNFTICVFDTDPDDRAAHRNACIAKTLRHRGFRVVSLNGEITAAAA